MEPNSEAGKEDGGAADSRRRSEQYAQLWAREAQCAGVKKWVSHVAWKAIASSSKLMGKMADTYGARGRTMESAWESMAPWVAVRPMLKAAGPDYAGGIPADAGMPVGWVGEAKEDGSGSTS